MITRRASSQPADQAVERAREALRRMIYETTSLSPMEVDGSHWCKISADALSDARAALTTIQPAQASEQDVGDLAFTRATRFTAYDRADPLAIRFEFASDADRIDAVDEIDMILSDAFAAARARMAAALAEARLARGEKPIKVRRAAQASDTAIPAGEDRWSDMRSLPIGDHRNIVFELRGAEGQCELGYWTGTFWAQAPLSARAAPLSFKPISHRLAASPSQGNAVPAGEVKRIAAELSDYAVLLRTWTMAHERSDSLRPLKQLLIDAAALATIQPAQASGDSFAELHEAVRSIPAQASDTASRDGDARLGETAHD